MILIDIILGSLLIWGTIQGIRQGFFASLASFIAYIVGIYLAIKFSYIVSEKLATKVDWNPKTVEITAFALTFVGVVILLFITAKIFTKIADWAYLGWINRLLGGLFGLLKYTLILSICLNLLQKINFNEFFLSQKSQEESIFYNKIEYASQLIFPSLEKWYNDFKELNSEAGTEKYGLHPKVWTD